MIFEISVVLVANKVSGTCLVYCEPSGKQSASNETKDLCVETPVHFSSIELFILIHCIVYSISVISVMSISQIINTELVFRISLPSLLLTTLLS